MKLVFLSLYKHRQKWPIEFIFLSERRLPVCRPTWREEKPRLCLVSWAAATVWRCHFDGPSSLPVSFNPFAPPWTLRWRRCPSVSCSQLDQRQPWPKSLPICFLASHRQEEARCDSPSAYQHSDNSSGGCRPSVEQLKSRLFTPHLPASYYGADVTVCHLSLVWISTYMSSEPSRPHQSGSRTPAANWFAALFWSWSIRLFVRVPGAHQDSIVIDSI